MERPSTTDVICDRLSAVQKAIQDAKLTQRAGFHLLFVLLFASLFSTPLASQTTTGDILGTVSDSAGAVISGASITIENLATHETRQAVSSSTGDYVINRLNAGHYSVTAAAPGFSAFKIADINLTAGDRARADVAMKVGETSSTIEVEATTTVLKTDSSVFSDSVVEKAVQDLPLNGRNYIQLAQVLPGSTEGSPNSLVGGNQADDRRQSSAVSVNGEPEILNNFLIDGMDNYEHLIGTEGVRPSIDAIAELRLATNAYTAEEGRTGGGVINIITKSGTDQFHGTAYEFLRNDLLNANAYAFGAHIPKPELRQNQFGASIGGPIRRDRTFFFGDYEGLRIIQGLNPASYTVPTLYEEQHIGDFSDIGGTVLTSAQLDPVGVDYFSLYPAPNVGTNSYVASDKKIQFNHTFDIRVDHRQNESNLFFARYTYNNTNTNTLGWFPSKTVAGVLVNPSSDNGLSPDRASNAQLNYVHIFNLNLLLELQAGYTYVENQTFPVSNGVNANKAFGQPNANYNSGLAEVNVSSATNLGISGVFVPLRDLDDTYQYKGTVTYTHGKHNFKFGAGIVRRQIANYQSSAADGVWSVTTLPNLVQGIFSSVQQNAALTTIRPRIWEPSFFVQDDTHLNRVVTLNLGLRYDIYTPYTDTQNGLSNFDPVAAKIVIAGQNGTSKSAGVLPDYSNVAPRVGFTASILPGTVLRGAFGMTFFPSNITSTSLLRNAPFIATFGPCTATTCASGYTRLANGLPPLTAVSATNPSGSILATPFNFRQTYLYQYNLNLQHDFRQNVITLGFVGSTGRHIPERIADINAPPLNTTSNYTPLRPYYSQLPLVTTIGMFQTGGVSSYSALQAVAERRFASGLAYNVNYTWAHNLDNSNGYGSGCGNIGYDSIPSKTSSIDYGNSCIDLRQRFSAMGNYALPIGKSLTGVKGMFAKGWQVNGLAVWSSGQPFTVANAVDVGGTRPGVAAGDRPNLIGDPKLTGFSLAKFFNTAAFQAQPAGTYGAPAGSAVGTIGTLAERKNQLFGPHYRHVDVSVFKTFPVSEKMNVEFRTEAFNIANSANFSNPNALLGSAPYGKITSLSPLYSPRVFQFALKLQY